jgi:arylsulfatase A
MRRLLHGTATIFLMAARGLSAPATAAQVETRPQPVATVVVMPSDDGTIMLSGSVATIRGTTLRWEPQETKRTLGFWTKAEDAAEWTFAVEAAGDFDVEVLQGCGKGQGGSEMAVTLDPEDAASATIRFVVEDTGGFQEFRARIVGRLTLAAGEHVIRVKPERIAKHAACDIRQIRLMPAGPR